MIDIGDIVIFTVREFTGIEYVVSLDDYDMEAYINILDVHRQSLGVPRQSLRVPRQSLRRKKLKIGSKNFGEVKELYQSVVILSMLDITDDDITLYRLCRKMSNLDGPKDGWYSECHNAIAENGVHPLVTISNRAFIEDKPMVFPKEYNDCIIRNHARLFGIKPYVLREKIGLTTLHENGNNFAIEKLNKIISEFNLAQYTSEELYQDWNRYNINITPLALPVFEIKVSAYLVSRCYNVISDVVERFKEYAFDVVEKCP